MGENVKTDEREYTQEQVAEIVRCFNDVLYFTTHYVKIVHNDEGLVLFDNPYQFQKELLVKFQKHRFNIALVTRQGGKTSVVGAYALWFAIFNEHKNIGITSNKEKSAKSFLSRIKKMYDALPDWIKPKATKWAETSVEFDNGSKIQVSATSADAFRGEPLSLLICDEFGFVEPSWLAEDFWSANYPTISASKTSKIIIISTPNGIGNKFHYMWKNAIDGKNTFVTTFADWTVIPGRDEAWATEQRKNLGEIRFNQEYACLFLGSSITLVLSQYLENLLGNCIDPPFHELKDKFRVYERPVENAEYICGIDVAKGTGENASAIQVLKIISINPIKVKQVAVFEDNTIDTFKFAELINRTCYYYNSAKLLVENNSDGNAVVNKIWWDFENTNLVCSGKKTKDLKNDLGIRATHTSKTQAVLLLKKLVESGALELFDQRTVEQLCDFTEKNGKYCCNNDNIGDDLVSALYWSVYAFCLDLFDTSSRVGNGDEDKINNACDAWGFLTDFGGDNFNEISYSQWDVAQQEDENDIFFDQNIQRYKR